MKCPLVSNFSDAFNNFNRILYSFFFFFLGAEDYESEIYYLSESNNHVYYSCNFCNFEIEEFEIIHNYQYNSILYLYSNHENSK